MIPVTSGGARGSQRGKGDVTRCTRFLAGLLPLFLIATGCHAPISAQRPAPLTAPDLQARRLRVRVVDTTGEPVEAAIVFMPAKRNVYAPTNAIGVASVDSVPAGRVIMAVRAIGYKYLEDTIVFVPKRGFSTTVVLIDEGLHLTPIACCDGEGSGFGRSPWRPPERLLSPPNPAALLAVRARPVPLAPPVTVADTALNPAAWRARDAADRPVRFGVMLGLERFTQARPSSDNGVGVAVDAMLQAPLPPRRLAVRGDLMYHTYIEGACTLSLPSQCVNIPFHELLSLGASVVGRMNDPRIRWSPYVLAGIELYATQGREAPTPAGLQAGVGFEVRLWRSATIVAEWRAMTVGATTLMPVTFGMRF